MRRKREMGKENRRMPGKTEVRIDKMRRTKKRMNRNMILMVTR